MAWNRQSGPGIKLWTYKKIMWWGHRIKPWTYQKGSCYQVRGSNPGRAKTSCMWGTWKHPQNALTSPTWNVSGGWCTTVRPTDDSKTNHKRTTDRPFERWQISPARYVPAEHIFFGNTSCTNLSKFLQVSSSYCKAPVENILQKYSSCTFTW